MTEINKENGESIRSKNKSSTSLSLAGEDIDDSLNLSDDLDDTNSIPSKNAEKANINASSKQGSSEKEGDELQMKESSSSIEIASKGKELEAEMPLPDLHSPVSARNKPPRHPVPATVAQKHRRDKSEVSDVSSSYEGGENNYLPNRTRNRTVSFDMANRVISVSNTETATSTDGGGDKNNADDNLTQANKSDGGMAQTFPPPTSSDAAYYTSPKMFDARAHWKKFGKSAVKLKDVNAVNPLETEAEAAILRIIDKARKQHAAEKAHILPHVPDIEPFVSPEEEKIPFLGTTAASTGSKRSVMNDDNNSVMRQSATVQHTNGGAPPAMIPAMTHRRKATLEETLFHLGNQMDLIQQKKEEELEVEQQQTGQAQAQTQPPPPPPQRTRIVSAASIRGRFFSGDGDLTNSYAPVNGGEALLDNASILFGANNNVPMWDVEAAPLTENIAAEAANTNVEDNNDFKNQNNGDFPYNTPSATQYHEENAHKKNSSKKYTTTQHLYKRWQISYLNLFLQPRFKAIRRFLGSIFSFVIIPLLIIASVFFYVFDNPDLGREGASISWLVLFLCRQAVTCMMAVGTEMIIIDFLSLQLRYTIRAFGPMFTLFIVQSKGYPFIMFAWGFYNFIFNSGRHALARHWLWWQNAVTMFSDCCNPSGTIAQSKMNYLINGTAMVIGVILAFKRLWWGFYLGRRTFRYYGDELARVFKNMVLISEVANLATEIQKRAILHVKPNATDPHFSTDLNAILLKQGEGSVRSRKFTHEEVSVDSDSDESLAFSSDQKPVKVIDVNRKYKLTGSLKDSQIKKIEELLGEWEEPDALPDVEANVSVASILQFRQMITHMDQHFPFTVAFGPADRRETCVESAQTVYEHLMLNDQLAPVLAFETIGVLARTRNGDIDTAKMKDLIRLFRPDRKGNLTMVHFVKSCDTVYRDMRLLRASIHNSGQINRAYEAIFNTIFFMILVVVVFSIFGLNALSLIVSFSGIFVSFAFMIGTASAKYFEGILFILARRPYDIGDRIAVSDINQNTSQDGSTTWFVQDVDLFTTTVRNGATNEVATLANGSLSSSRIINAKRSPNACIYVYMKFSVNVPYQKIMVFKQALESFIRDRPREWVSLDGFRATRIVNEQGFIEYITVLTHRDSWQSIGTLLSSKAAVSSFCLEVSKKLRMTYTAPPLPVTLSFAEQQLAKLQLESAHGSTANYSTGDNKFVNLEEKAGDENSFELTDVDSIAAMFRNETVAKNRAGDGDTDGDNA